MSNSLQLKKIGFLSFFITAARAFTVSTDVTFFIKHGMSFTQINLLAIVSVITIMLCELPTGMIADRYNRKIALFYSLFAYLLGYLLIGISGVHGVFFVAYFILGIAYSFQSGALNAWIADLVTSSNNTASTQEIQKQFAVNSNLANIGNLLGAISGGLVYTIQANFTWLFASLLMLIALILLISIEQKYENKKSDRLGKQIFKPLVWFQNIKLDIYKIYQLAISKVLLPLFMYSMISQIGMAAVIKLWQPAFLAFGNKTKFLGLIWGSFSIMNMIANWIVLKTNKISDSKRLIYFALLSGIPLIMFPFVNIFILAWIIYLIHVIGEAGKDPIIHATLHGNISAEKRASMESVLSISVGICEAIIFIISALPILFMSRPVRMS